jgi:hypothetical protein
MSNIYDIGSVTMTGRTYRNDDGNSTNLNIPIELAKELNIENSCVSISLLENHNGNKFLLLSKLYREIIID